MRNINTKQGLFWLLIPCMAICLSVIGDSSIDIPPVPELDRIERKPTAAFDIYMANRKLPFYSIKLLMPYQLGPKPESWSTYNLWKIFSTQVENSSDNLNESEWLALFNGHPELSKVKLMACWFGDAIDMTMPGLEQEEVEKIKGYQGMLTPEMSAEASKLWFAMVKRSLEIKSYYEVHKKYSKAASAVKSPAQQANQSNTVSESDAQKPSLSNTRVIASDSADAHLPVFQMVRDGYSDAALFSRILADAENPDTKLTLEWLTSWFLRMRDYMPIYMKHEFRLPNYDEVLKARGEKAAVVLDCWYRFRCLYEYGNQSPYKESLALLYKSVKEIPFLKEEQGLVVLAKRLGWITETISQEEMKECADMLIRLMANDHSANDEILGEQVKFAKNYDPQKDAPFRHVIVPK